MFGNKKIVSIIVCITMILCATMPYYAIDDETIKNMVEDQTKVEDYVENEITIETTTETETENDSFIIIGEDIIEDETRVGIERNSIIFNDDTTTDNEVINIFGDVINNDSNQEDDIEKPSKNIPDNTKKYKNNAKPVGFTVDIVDRDSVNTNINGNAIFGNGIFGSNPNLPDKYDSREHQNSYGVDIIPPPRDQNPYGDCWAFASIGMIETSIRSKNLVTSPTAEGADLSEVALALFTIEGLEGVTDNINYIDKPGVEGADYNCLNYDYYMNVQHIPRASMSFADCGGNEPAALMMASTYMGVVSESDCPHTEANIKAIQNEMRTTGLADSRKPYAFNKNKYELINAYFLNKNDRDSVKEAIMKYGSVGIGYFENRDDKNCHQVNDQWYYLAPDKAVKILDDGSCGEEKDLWANHAVMIVGWDDTVSFNYFFVDGDIYEERENHLVASYSIIEDDTGIYYPIYKKEESRVDNDGAWLVRNSWGDDNYLADHGYFWLPYDDLNLDSVMCAVDADVAGKYKYNYHYDTTLADDTYNYHGLGKLANIFKVSSDEDQVLEAVNIAWKSANNDYEIQIYTNDNQMSNPEDGELKLTQSVHNGSSGIKTIELDNSILVNKETYYSIIVKANTSETEIFYDCTHVENDWDRRCYNEVHLGESWENDSGTWTDLNTTPAIDMGDKIYGYTPRIRGLTNPAVAPSPTPTPSPSSSDGDGGSSGGGGGGQGPVQPNNQAVSTIEVSAIKTDTNRFNDSQVKWVYDAQTNKYKLNIDVNGNQVTATSGFYILNELVSTTVNNTQVKVPVQNTYYFDAQGSMVTGWVKTADKKTYFFETAKTKDEGKMIVGWKQLLNDWYYFGVDGAMYANTMTPDGYKVDANGKWIK